MICLICLICFKPCRKILGIFYSSYSTCASCHRTKATQRGACSAFCHHLRRPHYHPYHPHHHRDHYAGDHRWGVLGVMAEGCDFECITWGMGTSGAKGGMGVVWPVWQACICQKQLHLRYPSLQRRYSFRSARPRAAGASTGLRRASCLCTAHKEGVRGKQACERGGGDECT